MIVIIIGTSRPVLYQTIQRGDISMNGGKETSMRWETFI